MPSSRGWKWLVLGSVVAGIHSAVLPMPAITPAPRPAQVDVAQLQNRQDLNPAELLQVLLTALPLSLRQIAATNVPAVSRILWEDFLDDKRPQWFNDLPYDIQSYFIAEFGPATAAPPASGALPTDVTASVTEQPSETSLSQASNTDSSILNSLSTSASESSTLSESESSSPVSTPTASSSSLSSDISSSASSASSSPSSSASSSTSSESISSSSSSAPESSSATADPEAPASSDSGLTRREKLGIGIGVPLAVLAIAAILLACCFFLRRRRRRHVEGNEPPSSPGFIPRFSFQDRSLSSEHFEHRAPLNPVPQQQGHFVEDTNWDDDGYDPAATAYQGHTLPPAAPPMSAQSNMAMQDNHTPMVAPALYHSHSSNRARGRRTSYTSLHSVPEVDEEMESPVLGRHHSQRRTGSRKHGKSVLDMLPVAPVAASSSVKRKPVPTSPAAEASRNLLRPTLAHNPVDHSGSSSSGLAVSSLGSGSYHSEDESVPISPITQQKPRNPFSNDYAYLEDYGPEYSHTGYDDRDDELYGGHRSFDRYPAPRESNAKTDWPLRNFMGGEQKRDRSPMWDRVYERV